MLILFLGGAVCHQVIAETDSSQKKRTNVANEQIEGILPSQSEQKVCPSREELVQSMGDILIYFQPEFDDGFNFEHCSAEDFLVYLQHIYARARQREIYFKLVYPEENIIVFPVVTPELEMSSKNIREWIAPEELPILVRYLNSGELCASVMSSVSSYLPCQPSTVGREAAYLLEGFRVNRYPPKLNSSRFNYSTKGLKLWVDSYLKNLSLSSEIR